jgi:hypothetical protein
MKSNPLISDSWGDAVVERLSADLLAVFPEMRGFSAANIWRGRQFYEIHTTPEFLAQLAREMKRGRCAKRDPGAACLHFSQKRWQGRPSQCGNGAIEKGNPHGAPLRMARPPSIQSCAKAQHSDTGATQSPHLPTSWSSSPFRSPPGLAWRTPHERPYAVQRISRLSDLRLLDLFPGFPQRPPHKDSGVRTSHKQSDKIARFPLARIQ